ncbi:MarR family transcriptional regulator [Nocardioides korecus]
MGDAPDPHDQVVNAVLRASRALVAVSSRSLAEVEETLTMTQFRTLVVLTEDGPVSLHHLATRLGVASSTALRTVDRLLAADLVTRTENAEDRRQVVIAPSEEGHHVVAEVTARRRGEIARAVERMTSPAAELVRAFDTFADAVDQAPEQLPTSLGW